MPTSYKDLLAQAEAAVPKLSPAQAEDKLRDGGALVVDVRDPSEVEKTGKLKGAVNVSRGLLELTADPEGPHYDPMFRKDGTVLVYCTAGLRSALAGKTLRDMGFGSVFNIGGFKELADTGLGVEGA
ncbi:rhodanese-like domain-containing protein [Methylorubrum thiocyanatum]|uniref:rhodanese-like domain-containing protein n=1 Tax=Methylorubrum thiocyanatum TaxID=47958 RepID=UPI003F7E74B1